MVAITRRARALVLQALYEMDTAGHDPTSILGHLAEEATPNPKAIALAKEIIGGVRTHLGDIDRIIQRHAPQFPLNQMAVIDRSLLRIAIWEVLFDNRTPPKVAINEAVELAKRFGATNSYRFVNGVMGSVIASRQDAESAISGTSK